MGRPDAVLGARQKRVKYGLMPTLIMYGLIALAVAAAFGGTYFSGRQAGKAAERADWKPRLEACQQQVSGLENAVATQNRAVEALAAESKAKQARAAQGLARATQEAGKYRTEAERLRALAAGQTKPSACPAGEAVREIRRGLKGG